MQKYIPISFHFSSSNDNFMFTFISPTTDTLTSRAKICPSVVVLSTAQFQFLSSAKSPISFSENYNLLSFNQAWAQNPLRVNWRAMERILATRAI